ncbi:MAG: Holliday junction resolvase RuvX [Candidatus Zixiibacteriota bacterium]|nr:MAG: Holliday junction resolvase RuvX [candidate division Zixibacteria bacterium]
MFDKRIIGIDYGRKRIGVAYSDLLRITAQPLTTVLLKTEGEAVNRVCEVLAKEDVELVVVGLPVSLSGGTGGQMADEIRKFSAGLEKRGYRVVFEDERFTSAEAMATMRRAGKKEKQMRGKTDVIAAQLILQGYLDSLPK